MAGVRISDGRVQLPAWLQAATAVEAAKAGGYTLGGAHAPKAPPPPPVPIGWGCVKGRTAITPGISIGANGGRMQGCASAGSKHECEAHFVLTATYEPRPCAWRTTEQTKAPAICVRLHSCHSMAVSSAEYYSQHPGLLHGGTTTLSVGTGGVGSPAQADGNEADLRPPLDDAADGRDEGESEEGDAEEGENAGDEPPLQTAPTVATSTPPAPGPSTIIPSDLSAMPKAQAGQPHGAAAAAHSTPRGAERDSSSSSSSRSSSSSSGSSLSSATAVENGTGDQGESKQRGLAWQEAFVWFLAVVTILSVVGRLMLDGWLSTPEWLGIASTNTSAALTAVAMVAAERAAKCWRDRAKRAGQGAELLPTSDPMDEDGDDD